MEVRNAESAEIAVASGSARYPRRSISPVAHPAGHQAAFRSTGPEDGLLGADLRQRHRQCQLEGSVCPPVVVRSDQSGKFAAERITTAPMFWSR